jgi:hypothetical protein
MDRFIIIVIIPAAVVDFCLISVICTGRIIAHGRRWYFCVGYLYISCSETCTQKLKQIYNISVTCGLQDMFSNKSYKCFDDL